MDSLKCPFCGNAFSKGVIEILFLMNKEGEIKQYDVSQKIGVSYRTLLRLLKRLSKLGYIKITKTEPSAKGGKHRLFWGLTSKGIEFLRDFLGSDLLE